MGSSVWSSKHCQPNRQLTTPWTRAMAAQNPPKRRRIQPVPVEDDEAAAPQLPAATLVAEAPAREVPPPAAGRRIWVSLDDTYDHSWRKILAERGIKVAGNAGKRTKAPAATQPEARRDLTAMLAADRGACWSRLFAVTLRCKRAAEVVLLPTLVLAPVPALCAAHPPCGRTPYSAVRPRLRAPTNTCHLWPE